MRTFALAFIALALVLAGQSGRARAQANAPQGADPLPSWNDGPAKARILAFVKEATTPSSGGFLAPEGRVATFDQDGTLWTEHPLYTQAMFALDRLKQLAPEHPEWRKEEPFQSA